ncbi:MAG TPA: TolC family protein [Fimbriiglobus sp.]|jgi:outer membrane protein TolC
MLRRWKFAGRAAVAALVCGGCSRTYWRSQADRETYPIIQEHIVEPANSIGRTQVEPDPSSRLADPNNPDALPKPPDDPAAAGFMAFPDGMIGSKRWGENGYADAIERPDWESTLGLDEKGTLKLNQDKAVELALVNSRDYQTAVENVYLTALSLTLNRFEFATRWFAGTGTTYTHAGASSIPTESNTLAVTPSVGFNRNFAAGGQLLVDFANSFVWEFTGHSQTATGNIGVTFIQPLLRNFGRQVRLENLTQAERDTLYAVRNMARFRKQFWAGIAVTGGGGGSSYLNLLLTLQQVRNAKSNLRSQEENVRLYNEKFRGGRASVVEVDQVFQNLLSARKLVFSAEASYQSQLDAFKIQLGLPPRLPIEIDDSFLNTFVLTDPKIDTLHDQIETFQKARFAELDLLPSAATLKTHFATLHALAKQLPAAIDSADSDLEGWAADVAGPAKPDADPETVARSKQSISDDQKEMALIRKTAGEMPGKIDAARIAMTEAKKQDAYETMLKLTQDTLGVLDSAITIQSQSRINRIKLTDVSIPEDDALRFAKENRLDLKNLVGQVTDSWRNVTVAANALQSDLNVTSTANVATTPFGKNPFAYSAEASQFSVGVQFDGPLNRQAERNAYRASIITYQRSRRNFMALSDSIEQNVRNDLRQLALAKVSFEISKLQVVTNVRRLEATRLAALDQKNQSSTVTIDILQALQDLLNSKNDFVGNYVSYEQQRIQLFLDLEALQLDDRGFPCDLNLFRPDAAVPSREPIPAPATPASGIAPPKK